MRPTDVPRLSQCSALQLHLMLLMRATTCPGGAIATWVVDHDDHVVSVLSGAKPGHTSRVLKDGRVERLSRHEDGLRPLRAMAFGRWEPSRVWLQAAAPESVAVVVDAAKAWAPEAIVTGRDPTDLHRGGDIIELGFALPPPERAAAPADAVRSLREDPSVNDATPQEIQFEFLRRTRFNDFDGPRVARDLLAHRELWRAVIFGRDDVVFIESDGRTLHATPFWNTLQLLPEEESEGYNADEVWLLAPDRDSARALMTLAHRRWRCDEHRLWNRASTRRAAGGFGDEHVVSLWWD